MNAKCVLIMTNRIHLALYQQFAFCKKIRPKELSNHLQMTIIIENKVFCYDTCERKMATYKKD